MTSAPVSCEMSLPNTLGSIRISPLFQHYPISWGKQRGLQCPWGATAFNIPACIHSSTRYTVKKPLWDRCHAGHKERTKGSPHVQRASTSDRGASYRLWAHRGQQGQGNPMGKEWTTAPGTQHRHLSLSQHPQDCTDTSLKPYQKSSSVSQLETGSDWQKQFQISLKVTCVLLSAASWDL